MSLLGFLGGALDTLSNRSTAKENIKLQKQFAQEGVQWKVADAKKAGVHPLYALGAQTTSFQPVSVGGSDFASMGANLDSAINNSASPTVRRNNMQVKHDELVLRNMELKNDLLASQIATMTQPGIGPGVPTDAVGNSVTSTSPGGGVVIAADPRSSDAEIQQQRYGEPGEWVFGTHNLIQDYGSALGRWLHSVVPKSAIFGK